MTLPSPKICRRIRQLFRLIGSSNPNEAAVARKKLDKVLLEHALSWNDIPSCIAEADAADRVASPRAAAPQAPSGDGPQVNVLELVLHLIEQHIAITPADRMVGALFALHTHVFDRFDVTPFLGVTSPVRGCGKSKLLRLLAQLVSNPVYSEDVTPAVIYNELAYGTRTFLLDEADNLGLFNDPKMRRLLNSMWHRGGNTRRHIDGRNRLFSTYSPVALAAIGLMPLPLMSRCGGIVNMQRAGKKVKLERFDEKSPVFPAVRNEMQKWAAGCKLEPDPKIPPSLSPHSRESDNWRVWLAIADDLGYGEEARAVAVTQCANRPDEDAAVVALTDIRGIFRQLAVDRITSASLVEAMIALDESKWADWCGPRDDRPPHKLNQTELSRLLKPFGIYPRTIRLANGRTARGYLRSQFESAWEAYCPDADTPTQPSKIIHLPRTQSDT